MSVYFVEDPIAMSAFLSWRGPIGSDLRRRLRTLLFRSKMSAGVATGSLRSDLRWGPGGHPGAISPVYQLGLQGWVGSTVDHALFHHQGTRPHMIYPRQRSALRFHKVGKVVFASSVRHPGTRPNPYLTRWLREAVK